MKEMSNGLFIAGGAIDMKLEPRWRDSGYQCAKSILEFETREI